MQNIIKHSNKSEKAIIFIHGFPFDHHMWKYQVDYLQKIYTCITYDIRGLGQSTADGGQFTIEDLVDDLFSVISETGIVKPVICGLSMGGYIALRAVEKEENKFSGLILCDTKAESDSDAAKLKRAVSIRFINEHGGPEYTAAFIPECFSPGSIKQIEKDYNEILEKSLKTDPVGLKGCLLAMAGRSDTTAYLAKIRIPTLVLCGEEDNFSPPSVMRAMAEKINHSEFHVIKNAGHLSPVENPDIVNSIIFAFLNKIPA
jgi:pimeloyl-ACP methyl ester carboxylesterase